MFFSFSIVWYDDGALKICLDTNAADEVILCADWHGLSVSHE